MTIHTCGASIVLCTPTFRLWFSSAHEAAQWLVRAQVERGAPIAAVQQYFPTANAPRLPAIPRQTT